MGNKNSTAKYHDKIEKQMKIAAEAQMKGIRRILLLGSGSVGKSTVFHGIQMLSSPDIDDNDQYSATLSIRQNCVYCIELLCQKVKEFYPNESLDEYADDIKTLRDFIIHNSEASAYESDDGRLKSLGLIINKLWQTRVIQKVFRDRLEREYSIPSNMDYFFNKIEYIMSAKYTVDKDDYLRYRVRTTGLIDYTPDDTNNDDTSVRYSFRDVGGERNERKKWIHSFDNLYCIFFICGLSQYCTRMHEDHTVLGLTENLELFEELMKNEMLKDVHWVVLLNKRDLFRNFLSHQPLKFCFGEEYDGRNYYDIHPYKTQYFKRVIKELLLNDIEMDVDKISDDVISVMSIYFDGISCEALLDLVCEDGVEFIRQKFLKMKPNVMIYEMSAVNVEEVGSVVNDIKGKLLMKDLDKSGIVP